MADRELSGKVESTEAEEKERVRRTIGGIGGKPRRKTKILNGVFVAAVLAAFGVSLFTRGISRIVSIDVGILLLSLKFAYHLHTEAKVNHAQFWILTTIEDRLLNIISELRALRREFRDSSRSAQDDSSPDKAVKEHGNPQPED